MASPGQPLSATKLLAQANQLKTSDHSRFLLLLKQLDQNRRNLSPEELNQLQYLDAWQTAYTGKYDQANHMLHALVKRAGNVPLSIRAKALLVHNGFVERHYEQAYALAYSLMADLPRITDSAARMSVLAQVIQMLDRGDQYDLALQYARQMQHDFPVGKGRCLADLLETQTLLYRGDLTAASPKFRATINACRRVDQLVSANALSLDWADLMNEEGHPDRAIAYLHKVTPSIMRTGYQFHIAEIHVVLARAYLRKGDDAHAKTSALAAVAANDPGQSNWTLQLAYEVLYKIAHHAGDDAAAFAYYQKYVTQYKAATKHAKAQALAYQMVKQNVLAKKLKLEKLTKQNKILQLRQSLAHKATENNRLYILVLALLLMCIGLWAYRTKHSQLRFRNLAEHDELTGALTRRHFLELSEKLLRQLARTDAHACLLILDMDHFKRINDTHGHMNGDRVLRHVAAICRAELRTSDRFGRLGGEEFGLLLPDCSCTQGSDVGQRICRALAASTVALDGGIRVRVTASIGLACTDTLGRDLRRLLGHADSALYVAKRNGRNRLSLHGDATHQLEQGTPA